MRKKKQIEVEKIKNKNEKRQKGMQLWEISQQLWLCECYC